jgi:hypothetical protein
MSVPTSVQPWVEGATRRPPSLPHGRTLLAVYILAASGRQLEYEIALLEYSPELRPTPGGSGRGGGRVTPLTSLLQAVGRTQGALGRLYSTVVHGTCRNHHD